MPKYNEETKESIDAHQQGARVASLNKTYGISRYSIKSWYSLRKEITLHHLKMEEHHTTGRKEVNHQEFKNRK